MLHPRRLWDLVRSWNHGPQSGCPHCRTRGKSPSTRSPATSQAPGPGRAVAGSPHSILFDTGHFALETHGPGIGATIVDFPGRRPGRWAAQAVRARAGTRPAACHRDAAGGARPRRFRRVPASWCRAGRLRAGLLSS